MKYLILLVAIFYAVGSHSQNWIDRTTASKIHYGISAKLAVEYQVRQGPNFKLSLTAGIGADLNEINFFPTIHTGLIIFNNKVIGISLKDPWAKIRTHFFYSAAGTIKLDQRTYSFDERYVPFYHFSDFSANPLQNPYKTSFSIGAIWLNMQNKMRQRVGFFNFNALGRIQISYYNDGGPILRYAGDKRDRYYTGGLLVSYHGNEQHAVDLIEVSYHKFTGYVPHAFDLGDELQMDFLVYADKSQFAFNHQRWRLTVAGLSSGFAGSFTLYDINSIDLQDFLHFNTNVPYHPDYFQGYRLGFGGRYEGNYMRLPR